MYNKQVCLDKFMDCTLTSDSCINISIFLMDYNTK